jgi:hypothetical protein
MSGSSQQQDGLSEAIAIDSRQQSFRAMRGRLSLAHCAACGANGEAGTSQIKSPKKAFKSKVNQPSAA